jgi:long-subunit acyl-CoA synthetase (AMP-forming)
MSNLCRMKVLGSVGHPVKHTEIKVVDIETGEVVPDGTKGIMKVKGPQVMKGYYKVLFPHFTDTNQLRNMN